MLSSASREGRYDPVDEGVGGGLSKLLESGEVLPELLGSSWGKEVLQSSESQDDKDVDEERVDRELKEESEDSEVDVEIDG